MSEKEVILSWIFLHIVQTAHGSKKPLEMINTRTGRDAGFLF